MAPANKSTSRSISTSKQGNKSSASKTPKSAEFVKDSDDDEPEQITDIPNSPHSGSGGSNRESITTASSDDSQSEINSTVATDSENASVSVSQISVERISAPPYKPPLGFEYVPITASDLEQIFSPTALQGKELWHFMIPNDVPVSSIAELSTEWILSGAATLSHDGAEYGLIHETQDTTDQRRVLFPSSKTGKYESAEMNIAKTFHLQQTIRLPNSANTPEKPVDNISRKHTKPRIQQPSGLKMRYHPFGVPSGASDKSDSEPPVEEPPQAATFRVPREIGAPASAKKRSHTGKESPAKPKRQKKQNPNHVAKDLDEAQIQGRSQIHALRESPSEHAPAESKVDPHHPATISEQESPTSPLPKPRKKAKTHHQHEKEVPKSHTTPSSKSNPSTKISPEPHNTPLAPSNANPTVQTPKPSSSKKHKKNQDVAPSPGKTNVSTKDTVGQTLEKSPHLPMKEQQEADIQVKKVDIKDHDDDDTPRVSKRNETAAERAIRKAEKRKKKEARREARGGER